MSWSASYILQQKTPLAKMQMQAQHLQMCPLIIATSITKHSILALVVDSHCTWCICKTKETVCTHHWTWMGHHSKNIFNPFLEQMPYLKLEHGTSHCPTPPHFAKPSLKSQSQEPKWSMPKLNLPKGWRCEKGREGKETVLFQQDTDFNLSQTGTPRNYVNTSQQEGDRSNHQHLPTSHRSKPWQTSYILKVNQPLLYYITDILMNSKHLKLTI